MPKPLSGLPCHPHENRLLLAYSRRSGIGMMSEIPREVRAVQSKMSDLIRARKDWIAHDFKTPKKGFRPLEQRYQKIVLAAFDRAISNVLQAEREGTHS